MNFYEEQGKQRRYFYYIDLQGRLFLEDTIPKNIATSLKSEKFLTFFFGNLKNNPNYRVHQPDGHQPTSITAEYPYISPCGKEMNYISCADRPFVFHDMSIINGVEYIISNGSMREVFDPSRLVVSSASGRLYYPHKKSFGLVRSQLAVQFAESMTFEDGFATMHWNKQKFKIERRDAL